MGGRRGAGRRPEGRRGAPVSWGPLSWGPLLVTVVVGAAGVAVLMLARFGYAAAALDYAADLAANCSPASIRTMKAQLRAAADEDVLTSIANALELERRALACDDFAEGVRSFAELRPPRFPAPRAS